MEKLPRLRGAQGLPRLFGGRSQRMEAIVDVEPAPLVTLDDSYERSLSLQLDGDVALAKRVIRLQTRFPYGTVPELIVYDFLQRQGVWFEYQAEAFGGQRARRGALVDFTVQTSTGTVDAWRVMGSFIHTQYNNPQRDFAQRIMLQGAMINGRKVNNVIDIWDTDILKRDRDEVLIAALTGREISRPFGRR